MLRFLVLAVVVAASMLVLPAVSTAAEGDGKAIFDQLCQGCHTIGGGKSVGPDLKGLTDRRDRASAKAFILKPDSGSPMPNLGLTEAQVEPLLAYLGFAAGGTATTPTETTPETTPETSPGSGDAKRGESLFTGAERFGAGGPSCLSCHSIAGVGALGGGQLGPDLTGSFARFGGQQGLDAALKTVPFPTMIPIFSRKALTASERADLVAFLEKAPDRQRTASTAGKLVGFSVAAACLLVILAMGLWRHRLTGVRKPLVNRSRRK